MLALGQDSSGLALAAIVLGLVLCALPLLDRTDNRARTAVMLAIVVLAWRYVFWRFNDTIPDFDWSAQALIAWAFASLEAFTVVSLTSAAIILTRTVSRSREATDHASWWRPDPPPRVDVYIATYNEELPILERTIVGAKQIDYASLRVFVLDDGRREAVRALCERLGVEHRIRPDNRHAKAGNINFTLQQRMREHDAPDFIAVLDADFVPHRNFVSRCIALFHDTKVGLVQSPQHFFNPDPIQHNLGISAGYPDEQRFFFDHVEASRDAWGIAVCCGTSSMARTAALTQIGGLPTESVTEDFLLTLRLDENGWRTVYLNEPLTEGLAPEGLQEYIVQRGRWCLGMMQIVRNVYNPFGSHRLGIAQRFSMTDSVLYWTSTFSFRLASLICPLLYWYFGIAVVNASVSDVFSYYLPYYAAVLGGLNWLSRGLIVPLLNDVSQVLAAWPVTRAAAMGLIKNGPHKFNVTAKGGDRRRTVVQWPLLWPYAIVLTLTICGLFIGVIAPSRFDYDHVAGDGLEIVIFWTVYNIVLLALTILACIERPREDRPQRAVIESAELLVDERQYAAWVTDLGLEQARIRGPAGLSIGTSAALAISEVGSVQAKLIAATRDGYELMLSPSAEQRQRMIGKLHGSHAVPGTTAGDVGLMIKQLARRLAAGR